MKRKSKTVKEYFFTAQYEPVGGRGYQVTVPLLPGLVTYGRTFDEAREMARDAITCHLTALRQDSQQIPSEQSIVQERLAVAV